LLEGSARDRSADTVRRHLPTDLDHSGDLEGNLISLAQGALSDQLHNFGQVVVLLQDLTHGGSVVVEAGSVLFKVGFEDLEVLRVGQARASTT
jgi:hypothetical protein